MGTDHSGATPVTRSYGFVNHSGVLRPTSLSAPCSLCGATAQASEYDAQGRTLREIAHDGSVTFFAYDARGREVERATFPASYHSATTRPPLSAATSVISTRWHATFNLPTQRAEPGRISAWSYSAKGLPTGSSWTATTDGTGAAKFSAGKTGSTYATGYSYTAAGLVSTVVERETPVGGVAVETGRWTYSYDASGNRTREWNRVSGKSNRMLDLSAHGHVLEGIDGQNVRYRYVRDARGQVREYHYGVPSAKLAAASGGLTNLADGFVASYAYDSASRLVSVSHSGAMVAAIGYSPLGTVSSVTTGTTPVGGAMAASASASLRQIGGSGLFLCNRGTTVLPLQVGNHAYLWDVASQRCCSRTKNQDPLLSCAEPGPSAHACTFVEGSVGKEIEIMSCCQRSANDGAWRPWRNDCHDSAERCVVRSGLKYPGAPGGRAGQCSSCWLTPGADMPPMPTVP